MRSALRAIRSRHDRAGEGQEGDQGQGRAGGELAVTSQRLQYIYYVYIFIFKRAPSRSRWDVREAKCSGGIMAKKVRHGLRIDHDIERKLNIGSLQIEVKSRWSFKAAFVHDEDDDHQDAGRMAKQVEASDDEVVEVSVKDEAEPKVKISR